MQRNHYRTSSDAAPSPRRSTPRFIAAFSRWSIAIFACLFVTTAYAGPYTEPGVPGRVVDPADPDATIINPELVVWAGDVVSFAPSPGVNAANGDPTRALGPLGASTGGGTVSLGDLTAAELAQNIPAGRVTLRMTQSLRNGPGWDLTVFENGFAFFPPDEDKLFAELAYVEVSSDGATFARFPSASLTTTLFTPFGPSFAGIDPTDTHNLAGRQPGLVGTPFDFAELAATAEVVSGAVRLDDIRFVRVIDIPGDGSSFDSAGRPILEAWPSTDLTFGDGGFDLDAVAGRYAAPEPSGIVLVAAAMGFLAVRRLGRRGR